ncbi:B3 domain-containing protein [Populus alba x Populus x berolinensis]|nr:B3 domain-containing protein [Populus alba x Populus x berolinensis]
MGCPQNSQFSSMYGPLSYHSTPSSSITQSSCVPPLYFMPAPCESRQNPYMHSLEKPSHHTPSADPFRLAMAGQNAFEMQRSCILQPNALQLEQERRALEAYKTKVARCKRKLARQRSLSKTSIGAGSTQIMDARRLALHGASTCGQRSRSNTSKDLYEFLTPDNKRLRAVLRKDLKNSDVGSLGRIVLPKYFSITKAGRSASVPSPTLLIEQLDQKEQEEANSLVAAPPDSAYTNNEQLINNPLNNSSTFSQPASSAMQPSSQNGKMKAVDDYHVDDCYTGLGVLPDVYRYNFSL